MGNNVEAYLNFARQQLKRCVRPFVVNLTDAKRDPGLLGTRFKSGLTLEETIYYQALNAAHWARILLSGEERLGTYVMVTRMLGEGFLSVPLRGSLDEVRTQAEQICRDRGRLDPTTLIDNARMGIVNLGTGEMFNPWEVM